MLLLFEVNILTALPHSWLIHMVRLDAQARTYTVQLAKQLFEYTQGRNVIISSEAHIVSEIRNPADVFYL